MAPGTRLDGTAYHSCLLLDTSDVTHAHDTDQNIDHAMILFA